MAFGINQHDLIVVTGASGFVGSAIVEELLRGPGRIRAVVRPASRRPPAPRERFEVALGDMRDLAAMKAAMRGARFLFHVAADYRLWARHPNEIIAANVEGTRAVMTAAAEAGIERIVYTSSVATLAPQPTSPADETCALRESEAIGAYKRSKVAAERVVEAMVGQGLPAVIVNPSTPIGPRDGRPTPTGRILIEAAAGRMPAYLDTGLNLVHVDDVAAGHIAALERGRIGERYILGGDDVMLGRMLADIAALTGRRPPRVKLPRAPLFPLALVTEAAAQITGREPFLTLDGLRMAKNRMFFSSAKAERELGYRHRPYQEAIKDALDWFRSEGMLD
ncbi:MAG TPA: hopanoid-associated sugar epimerase [Stellaceae bacterium]|nr:hopanoid-associated sugar epimerase [Stellaceae bacterium]